MNKEVNYMNDKQKKNLAYVIGVSIIGVFVVLFVPMIFHIFN